MPKKVRYLLERDGRYFARLVVPKDLRPFLENRTELRTPLGSDYRSAVKAIHGAVADLQLRIRNAEILAADAGKSLKSARYPLTVSQIALRNYQQRLALDDELRKEGPLYASIGLDDLLVAQLRAGMSGRLDNNDLRDLVGIRIDRFRALGNSSAEFGTAEWRSLAIALCASEYEVLARTAERDEGDFTGTPQHPLLQNVEPVEQSLPPVSLVGLFEDYIASRQQIGRGRESGERWKPVFADLRKFLGHDDARRLTKKDVITWRDRLLQTRSPKTVRDVWLASLRAVLNWAVREDRLPANPAEHVRQDVGRATQTREKGYTDDEASAVLKACITYTPGEREAAKTAAAKRWVPLLAAFTGARVTELTQLRTEDVRNERNRWIIRITPDAGSVKTNQFRDVPLHQQVIDLGFMDFVEQAGSGPLFYDAKTSKSSLAGARTVSGRISEWLNGLQLVPEGVSPSHGWRHRFKTLGRELGYSDRVVDAICGHAGRTAGGSVAQIG